MRITFIRPNIGRLEHGPYIEEGRMEPLTLAVLAAYTPAGDSCVLYDDRLEAIPYDEPTDLVAITVEIYTARRAYEIAGEYRRRGVPVVMGGFHPTLLPGECLHYADAIVTGDGECVWPRVVEDVRRGVLRRVYAGSNGPPQPEGRLPRRDLFRGKRYLPLSLVQFGRGCHFACEFCAISAYFGRRHHVRPVSEVCAEIADQDRKFIFFIDDNLVSDHAAAKALLRALIPLRIRWVSQGSLDMTDDPELMDLIEASGGMGLVIGFESLQPESLREMRKGVNLGKRSGGWDRYQRQIEILRRHHLQTWAAFTLGHDHDTVDAILDTCRFAQEHRFCFAAFNILMPYPGTPLYRRLAAEGRLLWDGRWWLHPDYRFNHAAFVPRNMSPDELTAAAWECRQRWNSPSSICKRLWDFQTHLHSPWRLGAYLAYNRLYAREALKKQGMRLGLYARRRLPFLTVSGELARQGASSWAAAEQAEVEQGSGTRMAVGVPPAGSRGIPEGVDGPGRSRRGRHG